MANTSAEDTDPADDFPAIEHNVVIVGAGFAGLYAAKQLGRSGVDVLLLDQNNYHQFQPLLYQAATAQIAISTVARPLRGILHRQRAHVTIRTARVASVDAAAKTVTTDDGLTYRGRILVLATGSEPNFFDTPGARELAYPLYSVDDATSLSSAMLGALERAAAARDAAERQGTVAVVVARAGPDGVTTAPASPRRCASRSRDPPPPATPRSARARSQWSWWERAPTGSRPPARSRRTSSSWCRSTTRTSSPPRSARCIWSTWSTPSCRRSRSARRSTLAAASKNSASGSTWAGRSPRSPPAA